MRYSVTQLPVSSLLTFVTQKEIAIPEIQRPFVWDATKVRNLLDSLYQGFPVGYLIAWKNPTVKLKDGSSSAGKRVLIDGQQRITALMAALLGQEVVTKDYDKKRIRIAFHPILEKFEVLNPAIQKDATWIQDVSLVFAPNAKLFQLVQKHCEQNPDLSQDKVFEVLTKLREITNCHVGLIELDPTLDIETVTEIFIRVNSAGVELSQADFAMSKIATNETYGGNTLRKAIDYFCNAAVSPEFVSKIQHNDPDFARTPFFGKMAWLKNDNSGLYDPSYTDMLRVAFTSQFRRGRLQDLVALLSGRNFETKGFDDLIAEQSFGSLKTGVETFINETNFKNLEMIIQSAGFVDPSLIGSQNVLNFAYIIFLALRSEGRPLAEIQTNVRRWMVLCMLTGRYSGSPESTFDSDIRQMHTQGFETYINAVIGSQLSDAFWDVTLPQQMDTSSATSPYFRVFRAAQVKLHDFGFLSKDISVQSLIEIKSDVHHLYPANFLKKQGLSRGQYNQIANFAITPTEINIAISDKSPELYFGQLAAQCASGPLLYGAITDRAVMKENLRMNCIPDTFLDGNLQSYEAFLVARRHLMAQKMKTYFQGL